MIDIIGIAAVSTVADMIKYDKNMTQANERNLKSLHKLGESSFQRQEQEKKTRNAVVRCLKRKKALVETSIKDFVELYSKIGKIRFEESDGLKEIELIKQEQTDVQELAQTVICCANIKDSSSKLEIVAAVALGNIPMAAARSLRRDSENQLMAARVIKKEAEVLSAQNESVMLASEIVCERVDRITGIITKLNVLLRKSNHYCNEIIEKNGFDAKNYQADERKALMTCVNTAKTLKQIIDIPIFDEDGRLSEKSKELINLGNQYIEQMNAVAME